MLIHSSGGGAYSTLSASFAQKGVLGISLNFILAQSAGAVEYTDCISSEG